MVTGSPILAKSGIFDVTSLGGEFIYSIYIYIHKILMCGVFVLNMPLTREKEVLINREQNKDIVY